MTMRTMAVGALLALLMISTWGTTTTLAQQRQPNSSQPIPTQIPGVSLRRVEYPVNPSDPVAIVNGEVITRSHLANAAVLERGEEVLENLINRKIIQQAIENAGLDITEQDIADEIDHQARIISRVSKEQFFQILQKEKNITPFQYVRHIVYPTLGLRKLATPRVTVTEEEIDQAFDAKFGERIRCSVIMIDSLAKAREIWEQLRTNPGSFAELARRRSIDTATRALGGQIGDPIFRYSAPRNVTDAIYEQLVDGEPDRLPGDNGITSTLTAENRVKKPKDGDFTGPIQLDDTVWLIFKRDQLLPADTSVSKDDEALRAQLQSTVTNTKLQQQMAAIFSELQQSAEIDNKLTGSKQLPNEMQQQDTNVQATSGFKTPNVPPLPGTTPAPNR